MFAGRFPLQLLSGEKTQTRRKNTLARPGDLLWVRETWAPVRAGYAYRADWLTGSGDPLGMLPRRWKPAIHMPMEAARVWLRVLSVRPEELVELSESDALAEGFESRQAFLAYWESLGGPSSYRVLTVERTEPPHRMTQLEFPWRAAELET